MGSIKNRKKTIQEKQDVAFRKMSAEKKLKTAFGLNRLIFKIAKDSVRGNQKSLIRRMYV